MTELEGLEVGLAYFKVLYRHLFGGVAKDARMRTLINYLQAEIQT